VGGGGGGRGGSCVCMYMVLCVYLKIGDWILSAHACDTHSEIGVVQLIHTLRKDSKR
jgi:hypothetical protein